MIKAIETSYAGCRFRSRLEARWAVFFDHLSLGWQYEPQGYEITGPEWGTFRPRRYLPDFWLPGEKIWVEVKGSEDDLDHALILHAAIPHGGLPLPSDTDRSLLILGPIPRPGGRVAHSTLEFHEGDVYRYWAEFRIYGLEDPGYYACDDWLGNDHGQFKVPTPGLTEPAYLPGRPAGFVDEAYAAARSARFEHGQSGA